MVVSRNTLALTKTPRRETTNNPHRCYNDPCRGGTRHRHELGKRVASSQRCGKKRQAGKASTGEAWRNFRHKMEGTPFLVSVRVYPWIGARLEAIAIRA